MPVIMDADRMARTLTRIGPYGDFCGETRGVTKSLAASAHA